MQASASPNEPSVLAALADNELVVYIAYFTFLLPWTLIPSIPFVTSAWKSVRDTRYDGFLQIAVVSIPVPYMIFYILDQNASRDFKEMFAAVVGLSLSSLYILKTLSILHQLAIFREWAANNIQSLQAFGIPYTLNPTFSPCRCKATCESCTSLTPEKMADRLYVNETIIKSQLFNANATCYLQYRSSDLLIPRNVRSASFMHRVRSRFRLIGDHFMIFVTWIVDNIRAMLSLLSPLHSSTRSHRVRSTPYDPVLLWLSWIIPFVAQGLSHWTIHFRPPVYNRRFISSRLPNGSLIAVEDHSHIQISEEAPAFSAALLASASLHILEGGVAGHALTPNSSEDGVGLPCKMELRSPFLWDWAQGSLMDSGIFSKEELLSHAISTGYGLPFDAPHLCNPPNHLDGVIEGMGYSQYTDKLARLCETMPAGFGDEISEMTIEHLEWLAIILCLGAQNRTSANSETITPRSRKNDVSDSADDRDWTKPQWISDHMSPALRNESITAFATLQKQLGVEAIVLEHDGRTLGTTADLARISAAPLTCVGIGDIALGWSKALKASLLIDIWLSLNKGRIMGYGSCSKCLHNARSGILDRSVATLLEDENGQGTSSRELSKIGLSNEQKPGEHVLFLGVAMESIRFLLNSWADANPNRGANIWNPAVCDLQAVDFWWNGSADMMSRCPSRSAAVHMVWKMQEALLKVLGNRASPRSSKTVMLCLLSFPRLYVCKHDDRVYVRPVGPPGNVWVEVWCLEEKICSRVCGDGHFCWLLYREYFLKELNGVEDYESDAVVTIQGGRMWDQWAPFRSELVIDAQ